MKPPVERLVAYIRARRAELGVSQNELARLSGLNPGTLANIMVGRVTKAPSLETLGRLAVGLQVDTEYLVRVARGQDPSLGTGDLALHPEQRLHLVPHVRPTTGKFPLSDEEWEVIDTARGVGVYFDLERHRQLLEVSPADRKWLFLGLASLAHSIETNARHLSRGG